MARHLRWSEIARAFDWDGTWRDIYVLGASPDIWAAFLTGLRTWGYDIRYTEGGTDVPLPETFQAAFDRWEGAPPLLVVRFAGVEINCHFFSEDELEFDLDPRDFHGQEQLDALLLFMERIGQCVNRPVRLTAENAADSLPYLVYDPVEGSWAKHL